MSARLFTLAALALLTPACTLIANPNDHVGGMRRDAGPSDGGRDTSVDAPGADAPSPGDAGNDAASPPECTTTADCGPGGAAGIVECLGQRCVFCAAPTEATPHELRSATGLRPYLSLGVRRRPTGPALVVVGTMGDSAATPAIAHRAVIDAPSGAMDEPLAPAITASVCPEAFDSVSSIAFLPDDVTPSSTTTAIAVIAQGAMGGMITHLTWPDTTGAIQAAGFTCRTLTAPADFAPTSVLLVAPGSDGFGHLYQMTREATDTSSYSFAAYSYPYANQAHRYTAFGGPTGAFAAMTAMGPFMLLGGDVADHVVLWDPENTSAGISQVATPERTGDPVGVALSTPTMAGELLHFVMAYPVGNRVRFVNVDCDSSCNPVGESADLRTDAMTVTAARFGQVADVPVVLTSEVLADGSSQVVLRVLRANRAAYDAPGGGRALVLDRAPAGASIPDVQLAVVTGTTARYAAAWMVVSASGTSSVRLQTFDGTCPP